MDFIKVAKQLKHMTFLAEKRSRKVGVGVRNAGYSVWSKVHPFQFDPARYPESWISWDVGSAPKLGRVPNVIYCMWTGDNDLTPNRQRGLDSIRAMNPETEVVLITPANLHKYVVPGYPLHHAYENLSLNHRSDYLRSYIMHHHGGGYTDIKDCHSPWLSAIRAMQSDDQIWVAGYTEVSSDACAWMPDLLGRDLRRHYLGLVGNGAFIVRPNTEFTTAWRAEVERRMNYYADQLAVSPGGMWGETVGYPVPWTKLQSQVFQPLQLKYAAHVRHYSSLKPALSGHR